MEIIERYIYAVTKDLSEKNKKEIEKELRANIEDMLESYEDDEVKRVLTTLGDPKKLSDEYRDKKRYLIAPAQYGLYTKVLKIAITVLVIVNICLAFLDYIAGLDYKLTVSTTQDMAKTLLISGFQGGIEAFAWVTIWFAILDRFNVKLTSKSWSLSNLEPVPKIKTSKKSDCIITIIISLIFPLVILLAPSINQHFIPSTTMDITNIINFEYLSNYIISIIIITCISIVTAILKYKIGNSAPITRILGIIFNISFPILVGVIFLNENAFIKETLIKIQQGMEVSWDQFINAWNWVVWACVIATAITCITDCVKLIRNK